jgi:hypothetical protein
MKRPSLLLAALLLSLSVLPAREFHVAPSGDDRNPGTAAAPWRTLEGRVMRCGLGAGRRRQMDARR